MPNLPVTLFKERGIIVQAYEHHPETRKHVQEPVPIKVTLQNTRREQVEVWTYFTEFKRVLQPDDYLQLVVDRYYEDTRQALERTWQYRQWGPPVHINQPKLRMPGAGRRYWDEFHYYLFDPAWMTNSCKAEQRVRERIDALVA